MLLVGILWIIAMTYICYRGIEVSANFQKVLLSIELVMLLVLSVTALVRVYSGNHPPTSVHPSFSWLLPTGLPLSAFIGGIILMLFIYWGWDTAVSVNEETKDKNKTPGQAAIISTVLLLVTYAIVIISVVAFAGTGSKGIGLTNSQSRRRRAVGARQRDLRHRRLRHLPVPAAAPDGAQLGGRLHPDDHPADRPHHPVDGRLPGAARSRSPRYTAST